MITTAPRISIVAAVGGGLGGLLTLGLGLWWLIDPTRNVFANHVDPLALTPAMPPLVSAALLTGVGFLSLLTTGLIVVQRTRTGGPSRLVTISSVAVFLGFFLLISDASLLMMLGYLLAGALPAGILVAMVLGWRRSVPFRFLVVLTVVAIGVWAWVTPTVTLASAAALPAIIAGVVADLPLSDVLLLPFAACLAAWGVLLSGLIRCSDVAHRIGDTVGRVRLPVTWIAALCPLPYFLVRLSWLVPGISVGPEDMSGELRIWGLLLGGAAALGSVLTIGLLCRWGRIFPAWMPRIGGRPVPVATAVVPATLVGIAVTVSAAPMIVDAARHGSLALLEATVGLPFWLWGPALLIATWAYARHRSALRQAQGTFLSPIA